MDLNKGYIYEILFWLGFMGFNALHYLINYILYFRSSKFLPYVSEIVNERKLGIGGSPNQDIFRYTVEFSLAIIVCRYFRVDQGLVGISSLYTVLLMFNLYQYSFRKVYQRQANFYTDYKLVKNAVAIVWHESSYKVILGVLGAFTILFFLGKILVSYLTLIGEMGTNLAFYVGAGVWLGSLLWSLYRVGIQLPFPFDINHRYHFTTLQVFLNFRRSIKTRNFVQNKRGKQFAQIRSSIGFQLAENPPNIFFIFVESYGAYYYKEPTMVRESESMLDGFTSSLSKRGWNIVSNYSQSPITGGQSWLTYSSMLNGLNISDNTHFESYLNDSDFRGANNLLRVLNNSGYTNFNLNPIRPIKGINVPYDEMREFYCIDHWVLHENIGYKGDVYGFGACPPDQFSMNHMMEVIQKENKKPFTYFYLTKNSHSPFIPPKLVEDWKTLNHPNGQVHVHKGFLKQPTKEDYQNAIKYELDNLERFITDHGSDHDIFLIMGDHQPPILSDPQQFGSETPVHLVSKNQGFLQNFQTYGFQEELKKCSPSDYVKHEAMYSIFLRAFMKTYATEYENLPEYEPDGLQLH